MHPALRSHRPLIMGRRGAVATNHPHRRRKRGSTHCGPAAMRWMPPSPYRLTLGVVEPADVRASAATGSSTSISRPGAAGLRNATGAAPAPAMPERATGAGMPVRGPRSISTPGRWPGWRCCMQSTARLPWARLVAPAIEAARDGFAATHAYRHFAERTAGPSCGQPPSAARLACADGAGAGAGALVMQPELADTLDEIAADGAEGFYRGRLAAPPRRRDRRGRRRRSPSRRPRRLHRRACRRRSACPIAASRSRQTPPNSTGFTFLQMLRILERFDLARARPGQRGADPPDGRGEEARLPRPRALGHRSARHRHPARAAAVGGHAAEQRRRDRHRARRRPAAAAGAGKRHHLFLRGGRGGQCGLRHPVASTPPSAAA